MLCDDRPCLRAFNRSRGWVALGMGLLFIYLFQLIARTTQTLGLTVTSIASKLSMVLPVALFLAFDPLDALIWKNGVAIALAIPAIVLASWKEEERTVQQGAARWVVPLVIFVGSGCIDLMFAAYSGKPTCNPSNTGTCSLLCR